MSLHIFTTLKRGYTHPLFCEDFLFTHSLGQRYTVAAVMDGSTMGTTSYFASTLVAKLLNKVCITLVHQPGFQELQQASVIGKALVQQLFQELKQARKQLFLSKEETLTTLLLLLTDQVKRQTWVMAIGDGLIALNDSIRILDQGDRPGYLADYMCENFDDWWANYDQIWEVEPFTNLAIATDGLLAIEFPQTLDGSLSFPQQLMINDLDLTNPYALDQTLHQLQKQYQADFRDDIAMVRIIMSD